MRFAISQPIRSGAGIFDAETYISTQQAQALEEARVPDPDEDQERGGGAVAPPGQGAQARCRKAGFPRLVSPNQLPVAGNQLPEQAGRSLGNRILRGSLQGGERVNSDASKRAVAQAEGKFPRGARLLKHSDFDRVYQQGRRHFSSHLTVFYLRQAEGASPEQTLPEKAPAEKSARVGLTVGKVLGGAVVRNRIKRRLREAVRRRRLVLPGAVDVVINPKKSVLSLEFPLLLEEVGRALDTIAKRLVEK